MGSCWLGRGAAWAACVASWAFAAQGCSRPSPDASKAGPSPSAAARASPCGPVECSLYDAPEAALEAVLAPGPRVLAVGEAHAQKGEGRGASVTKRFADRLLPSLKGRASDLLVELMLPPKGCAKAEEAVRERQAPALAPQADTNQGDYVALGEAARRLGVVPDALRPSCDDLAAIDRAGDDAIAAMMTTIARLSEAKARELLARPSGGGPGKLVVIYGGALHNDLVPKPGREPFSFGPALERAASGAYAELDVYAPEAMGDTEAWRALPWYGHYDAVRFAKKAVLFRAGPKSYALVLPREAPLRGGRSRPGAGRGVKAARAPNVVAARAVRYARLCGRALGGSPHGAHSVCAELRRPVDRQGLSV